MTSTAKLHRRRHPAPRSKLAETSKVAVATKWRPSRWRWPFVGLAVSTIVVGGYLSFALGGNAEPPVLAARVVRRFPHDPAAYTQGLLFDGGKIIEGTGRYGQSTLREVDLATGRVERQVALEDRYFGEGIALVNGKILQLTWKDKKGFIYDRNTLAREGTFDYQGEGWGLTYDGKHLIMSDGTSRLRFIDPRSWKVDRQLVVRVGRRELSNLNELEFVDGYILANVWYEDYLAKISPKTGQVVAWIDLRGLYPQHQRPDRDDVLNGIAYDPVDKRYFVTGKHWPSLFEIEIVDRP